MDVIRNLFTLPLSPKNGNQYCLEEENYYDHYKKMSKIFHCCSLSVLSVMMIEERSQIHKIKIVYHRSSIIVRSLFSEIDERCSVK